MLSTAELISRLRADIVSNERIADGVRRIHPERMHQQDWCDMRVDYLNALETKRSMLLAQIALLEREASRERGYPSGHS